MKRIINVSNRLPIKIDKKGNNITKSSGGLVTALEGVRSDYDLLWVGWTGNIFTKDSGNSDLEKRIYREFKYVGINLNSTEVENFYNGFSNTSLWPLLHYIVAYFKDNKKWWESYCTVNKKYAEKVVEYAKEGDIIWVHDYHLMLLPTLLREKIKNVKIGFFLHTPFPSYEIFRCHPNRESLIKGMLGADLIGFHTFGYLRHFRSTVLRILGYESEIYTIPHDGNQTKIGFFPIGISWNNFETTFKTEAYQASLEKYKNLFQNKKVVLSVERMDYTKGIPEKIASIEYLLKKYNEYRNSLVFYYYSHPQ